jgi:hypothetical protein
MLNSVLKICLKPLEALLQFAINLELAFNKTKKVKTV